MADILQELPAGTELAEYRIERTLGQGGFGITYLATDTTLGKRVVIKENLPFVCAFRESGSPQVHARGGTESHGSFEWAMKSFLNEARTLAQLDHPNIVQVIRAFEAFGTAYFVMPYIEGESLDKWREANAAPDEAWLRRLLGSLLDALQYLHGRRILHRDIKPANILLSRKGVAQLIDFGTARQLISEKSQTVIESAGYTPIEQMQSHGKVGPWSDIYALGCTLCKLITGETPPRNSDRVGKVDPQRPLAARPELSGRYSAGLLASIDKAMAVWPEDRWQSADAWAEALAAEAATPTPQPQPAPQPQPTPNAVPPTPASPPTEVRLPAADKPKKSRKKRAILFSLLGCALLTGLLACWFLLSGSSIRSDEDFLEYCDKVMEKASSFDSGFVTELNRLGKSIEQGLKQGFTADAVRFAAVTGSRDALEYLVEKKGASVDMGHMNLAATFGHEEVVKYLFEKKHINPTDDTLEAACRSGNLELCKYLLEEQKVTCHARNVLSNLSSSERVCNDIAACRSFSTGREVTGRQIMNAQVEIAHYLYEKGHLDKSSINEFLNDPYESNDNEALRTYLRLISK